MTVVIVVVALVVLAVVVYVAIGGGGELSIENSDYAPLDLGPVSATDVVLLRPPTALWGYSVQATDEALEQIAASIRDRDVRIVALEQLVTDLSRPAPQPLTSPPYSSARHRRADEFAVPGLPAVLPLPPETDMAPATAQNPVVPPPPAAPAESVAPAAGEETAEDEIGSLRQRGTGGGQPGAASGGERERERGVSGGGVPPEQSHG